MPAQLNIRNLDPDVAARIRRAARIRGMNLAQYITALSELHTAMLIGIHGDAPPRRMLAHHGLGRVEER